MLKGKKIVLGVTSGIAAYKIPFLVRKLKKEGAEVFVIMTEKAQKIVGPATLATLSGNRVVIAEDDTAWQDVEHISYAREADLLIIAPATANTIAKIAHGIADNLLTTTVLATEAPVLIAPAMNRVMFEKQVTQENITKVREFGYRIIGPETGELACGEEGIGRMAEVERLFFEIERSFVKQDLAGKKVIVTLGGTYEPIDSVRGITNLSSGKMGQALVYEAALRGAEVVAIQGRVEEKVWLPVDILKVQTAADMLKAVKGEKVDILVMAAAVGDFKVKQPKKEKIKKSERLTLALVKNTDVLKEVKGMFKVGFCLEDSATLIDSAWDKMIKKAVDLMVFNTTKNIGQERGEVSILAKTGTKNIKGAKNKLSRGVLDEVAKMVAQIL